MNHSKTVFFAGIDFVDSTKRDVVESTKNKKNEKKDRRDTHQRKDEEDHYP